MGERCPDSPVDVRRAPDPREHSNDELELSEDDMEAERDRQAERRRLHFRRMDEQERELRRFNRADPAPSGAAAKPRRSSGVPRPKSPTRGSPVRDAWPDEPPDDYHTPTASADGGDTSDDPATPQDRPEKKPIPLQTDATTPRRSGRARQPPQWYTPSPQK